MSPASFLRDILMPEVLPLAINLEVIGAIGNNICIVYWQRHIEIIRSHLVYSLPSKGSASCDTKSIRYMTCFISKKWWCIIARLDVMKLTSWRRVVCSLSFYFTRQGLTCIKGSLPEPKFFFFFCHASCMTPGQQYQSELSQLLN